MAKAWQKLAMKSSWGRARSWWRSHRPEKPGQSVGDMEKQLGNLNTDEVK